jgi:hypothetical protein
MDDLPQRGGTAMVADNIGLFPGFGWLTSGSWSEILFKTWLLTPIGFILVGIVGESRLVPLLPKNQFLSFFPGDLFLGVGITIQIVLAGDITPGRHWFQSIWFHLAALLVCLAVAVFMTFDEYRSGAYPLHAILSPTKLYHNGLLYVGYGYLAATTAIAELSGSAWSWSHGIWLAVSVIAIFVWVQFVALDNKLSDAAKQHKWARAHIAGWLPFWYLFTGEKFVISDFA